MRKNLWYITFFLFQTWNVIGQDIHFTQYDLVPLSANPAFCGLYEGYYRGSLHFRNQWPAMGKPFTTFAGSFDLPMKLQKKKSTIGLGTFIYRDKAGDSQFSTTQAAFPVSAIIPVSESQTISAGIVLGIIQHSWDLSEVQWPNQYNGISYDPSIAPNETLNRSFTSFDAGAGMNYHFERSTGTIEGKDLFRADFGLAYQHVSFPLQKYYGNSTEHLYRRFSSYLFVRYDLPGTKFGIEPSVKTEFQGPATAILTGASFRYKINQGTKMTGFYSESAISAGLYYRYKDSVQPRVLFEYAEYTIGFSYDFNVSSFSNSTGSTGAVELMFRYASMKGAIMKQKK